jgi:putative copper export protein
MTEITQENWKHKALGMLMAQFTAYVLLIAATVIPIPGTKPIVPLIVAAVIVAAFAMFWPFRGTLLDRIATVAFGALSLVFVIVPFPSGQVPPNQTADDGSVLPWYSWALAAGCLLVVLVVLAFARQMIRETRSHLIRALSHAITSCVAAIAVAGWCFLPNFATMLSRGTNAGTAALIVIIVLALALALASTLWVRDADPEPTARYPWIGTGLLPVMLMGVTIAATTLILARFIN